MKVFSLSENLALNPPSREQCNYGIGISVTGKIHLYCLVSIWLKRKKKKKEWAGFILVMQKLQFLLFCLFALNIKYVQICEGWNSDSCFAFTDFCVPIKSVLCSHKAQTVEMCGNDLRRSSAWRKIFLDLRCLYLDTFCKKKTHKWTLKNWDFKDI